MAGEAARMEVGSLSGCWCPLRHRKTAGDDPPESTAHETKEPAVRRCPLRKFWDRMKPKKKTTGQGDRETGAEGDVS